MNITCWLLNKKKLPKLRITVLHVTCRLVGSFNPTRKHARQAGFIFPKDRGENKKTHVSCHHPGNFHDDLLTQTSNYSQHPTQAHKILNLHVTCRSSVFLWRHVSTNPHFPTSWACIITVHRTRISREHVFSLVPRYKRQPFPPQKKKLGNICILYIYM